MMKRLFVCTAMALALMAPKAEAAFLSGSLEYDWIGATLSPNAGQGFGANDEVVSLANGDSVGSNTTGSFDTIVGDNVLPASVANFFYGDQGTIGGAVPNFVVFQGLDGFFYTFSVTSFTTITAAPLDGSTPSNLFVSGLGIWTSTNAFYSPTSGGFTISGDTVDGQTYSIGGTLNAFNVPTNGEVPEPASMMLLGSGLVGVASAARKRRKAKQAQQ